MDQVYVIRHKVLVEGLSARRVAREMGVSRNTIRRYVTEDVELGIRKPTERMRPVYDAVRERLEAVLADAPRWTGGKQRLTAARLHEMLREEGHESFVREWRRKRREVFVPLVYLPGDLAEVDFFQVLVDVEGERQKAWMFVMRLMCSGRDFAWVYERQDQVSFLDGHVRAFAHFGAVPHRIVYDNLRAAVSRVLVGSERELAPRFQALAAHYVFEPCFARPGTGHDKGGVEARGKGIRWQHLVPIPSGQDLEAISGDLLARLDRQASDKRGRDGKTAAERFETEQGRMLPLPEYCYRASAVRSVRVSRRSLAKVEGAHYSVWSRWASLDVTAYVGPYEVELVGPDAKVTHRRQGFGGRSVDYRHYIRELSRKPQAVRQVASELVADLGEPFGALWRRLVDQQGPKQAARVFAQVLKALEELGEREVVARLERVLTTDEPIVLALQTKAPPEPSLASERLPRSLEGVEVVGASASDYDALLGGER